MPLRFDRNFHRLTWDMDTYDAISGPWGNGQLPVGEYRVRIYDVVTGNDLASGYEDTTTNTRWFIPIEPLFSTSRIGLGIHPDGNVPGTQGCVGLRGADAARFWTKWNGINIGLRPTSLTVI